MEPWVVAALASITSLAASSGFWAYLQSRDKTKTAVARLLMGLAYDKIMHLGVSYIERGWISKDEYEDFRKYLYEPYKDFGGNGVAERIMLEVSQLKIRSASRYSEIDQKTLTTVRETNQHEHH
jgi:hypothetical protein